MLSNYKHLSFFWLSVCLENKHVQHAKLYGSISDYAYYYVLALVGSPPQSQSLIVDTGSSVLAFSCSSCEACGNHDVPPYNVENSSSGYWLKCNDDNCHDTCDSDNQCSYVLSYAEGSVIKGKYFSDIIALGNSETTFVRYNNLGCHLSETNLFVTQRASGIMGLNFLKKKGGVINALFNHPDINTSKFSICLSEEGGRFSVGDIDKDDFIWTAIQSSRNITLQISKLRLNDEFLEINREAMIDSGTTYIYLDPFIAKFIKTNLNSFCTSDTCNLTNYCWRNVDFNLLLNSLPVFKLELSEGNLINWHASSYLFLSSSFEYCLGIVEEHGSFILGANFFKNHEIAFDVEQKKVGIRDEICPEVKSIHKKIIPVQKEKIEIPPSINKMKYIIVSRIVFLFISFFLLGIIKKYIKTNEEGYELTSQTSNI